MKSRTERIEYIRRALSAIIDTDPKNFPVPWRNQTINPPIIRLDISYLMFWLENSRTIRQQIEYQQNHKDQPDIFNDPETTIGQDSQYMILKEMLNTTGKDIIRDLDDRGQKEPAIITQDGFIINGNRRIAAMHILGKQYADCVVLPSDAIKNDLYDLEQELQLSQDFKQPYHWINELLNIDYGLNTLNNSIEEMAKRLRITVKDITEARRRKLIVDDFLTWKKLPSRYDYGMLDDAEQIFKELEKFDSSSHFNQSKKEQVKLAVFSLIEIKPEEGRLYAHVKNLIKHFDEVQELWKEQGNAEVETEIVSGKVNVEPKGDLIDVIIDEGSDVIGVEKTKIKDDLAKPENAQENSIKIVDILADVIAVNKERDNSESLCQGVNKALKLMSSLTVSQNSTRLEETKGKLEIILKKAYDLIEKIEKI